MLQKTMKIFCFTLLLFIQAGFAHADQKWVAVSVFDGRGKESSEYYGSIDSLVFDQITKKLEDKGMFQLSSVFWINEEGKITEMKDAQNHGLKYGYTNTIYLREDAVTRIVLLDKGYLDSLNSKAANNP